MKKSDLIQKLGRQIASLRKARGLSQEDFADISGKMINTVSNIERGLSDPKVSTLEAIAKTLGTEVSTLFEDIEQTVPKTLSDSLETLIKILKTEDEKTIRTVLKQTEALLAMKKDNSF